jgi:hypothetical protein
MDAILETLKAFETNHVHWKPEQFNDIQNEEMRKAVRAAFREPENFIQILVTSATKKDMDAFVTSLREKAPMMSAVTLAELLHTMYTFEQKGLTISVDAVKWYRDKGWAFPPFLHETTRLSVTTNKKIDTAPPK